MSALTKEQIAALPGMVADAIPGPWKADKHPAFGSIYVRDDPVQWDGRGRLYVADVNGARPFGDATARLIAHAPTLAATVIEQQAEIERLRWWLSEIDARGKQYGPEELADLALEGLVGTPAQGVQP